MMQEISEVARQIRRGGWHASRLYLSWAFRRLRKHFMPEQAITGWDFVTLSDFIASFVEFTQRYPDNASRHFEAESRETQALLLTAMHFQDAYNFELPRVQRCLVHYSAPDGRTYPFCTYNSGPIFRNRVEALLAKQAARMHREGT